MANFVFVQGQEFHSSHWGESYVKGLEDFQTKEHFTGSRTDNRHNYDVYVANNVPNGTLFTIFEQNGSEKGTESQGFIICEATDREVSLWEASYGSGKIIGNYRIIASGDTKAKASRLMDWWINSSAKSVEFALWCATQLEKRELKHLPPTPQTHASRTKEQELKGKIAALKSELATCEQELADLLSGVCQ